MKLTINNTYSDDLKILSINDIINIPFDEVKKMDRHIELHFNDSLSCTLFREVRESFSKAMDESNKTQGLD